MKNTNQPISALFHTNSGNESWACLGLWPAVAFLLLGLIMTVGRLQLISPHGPLRFESLTPHRLRKRLLFLGGRDMLELWSPRSRARSFLELAPVVRSLWSCYFVSLFCRSQSDRYDVIINCLFDLDRIPGNPNSAHCLMACQMTARNFSRGMEAQYRVCLPPISLY